jgi:hypothetical protein
VTFPSPLRVGALSLAIMGCTSSYVVVPATGGKVAASSAAGVSMAAYPESWNRDPPDLPEYLTPIWVTIVNQTSHTVRLRYEDFALTDASRFRYAAISPYSGQPEVPARPAAPPAVNPAAGAAPPPPAAAPSAPAEPEPSERDPGPTTDVDLTDTTSPWSDNPDYAAGAQIVLVSASRGGRGGRGGAAVRGGGFRGRGGFHRGYYDHPRAHVYVGPRPFFYDPWWPYGWGPYPYYWGAYYYRGPYVYSWDYGYYPAAPTADILRFGLPEGELGPGGRVAGYIYFQHAVRQPGRLDLTWNVHGTDGRSLASVTVPMRVVRD